MYFALKCDKIMQILGFKTTKLKTFNNAFVTLKQENANNHFGARLS
jgi:hypothetical protein